MKEERDQVKEMNRHTITEHRMEGKIQKVTCDSFYYNLKLLAETLDI